MINVELELREDLAHSEVHASGFELLPLTDPAAHAFGIPRQIVGSGSDAELWPVIKNWWGRSPDEFLTSDPVIGSRRSGAPHEWNPWEKDGWGEDKQVRVERKVVGARLIAAQGEPDSITLADVVNYDTQQQALQHVSYDFAESAGSTRTSSKSWSLSMTQGIEVKASGKVDGIGIEVARSMSFTAATSRGTSVSRATSKSRSVTLTATVNAAPRRRYPVSVAFGRGRCEVLLEVEYRLMGAARALYLQRPYSKGHFESPPMDIVELLRALGKPEMVTAEETLDFGFVGTGTISVGKGVSLD